jgi:hypothetical protein
MCCRKEVLKTVPTSRGETGKVNDFEKTTPPSPAVIQRVDKVLGSGGGTRKRIHNPCPLSAAAGSPSEIRYLLVEPTPPNTVICK